MVNTRVSKGSFKRSVDRSRPHILEGEFNPQAAVFTYRYTDTDERVTVPNIWNNRPQQMLAEAEEQAAVRAEERARRLLESPPPGVEADQVEALASYHRIKAERLRGRATVHQ